MQRQFPRLLDISYAKLSPTQKAREKYLINLCCSHSEASSQKLMHTLPKSGIRKKTQKQWRLRVFLYGELAYEEAEKQRYDSQKLFFWVGLEAGSSKITEKNI
jgi:hypothetical protein